MGLYKKDSLVKKMLGNVNAVFDEFLRAIPETDKNSGERFAGDKNQPATGESYKVDIPKRFVSTNKLDDISNKSGSFSFFSIPEAEKYKKNTVLVACSGGADSLALAYLTKKSIDSKNSDLAKKNKSGDGKNPEEKYTYYAAIIDHGVQRDSHKISIDAKNELIKCGYPEENIFIEKISRMENESQGRELRYKKLEEIANKIGAKYILTGHTLDDVAENVLLGLARGSGTKSLASISVQNGRILRPLLDITREETIKLCEFANLNYWSDPTNGEPGKTDESFPLRSRVRNEIMPALRNVLGENINKNLARTGNLLETDDACLDSIVNDFINEYCNCVYRSEENMIDYVSMPVEELYNAHESIRTRAIKKICDSLIGFQKRGISYSHIKAIENLVTDWHGQKTIQLPKLDIYRDNANKEIVFKLR